MSDATVENFGMSFSPMDALTGVPEMRSPLTSYMGQQPGLNFLGGPAMRRGIAGYPTQNFIVTTINENHEYHQHWNDSSKLLFDCLNSLLLKMDALTTEIDELRNAKTFVVPLTSLYPEPLKLTMQLPLTIESYGDEFTATFTEANISASGETEADAIANFKESLMSSFEILESKSPQELGPLPMRQWHILSGVVERI
jgi:hypothetical protein